MANIVRMAARAELFMFKDARQVRTGVEESWGRITADGFAKNEPTRKKTRPVWRWVTWVGFAFSPSEHGARV